MPGSVSPVSQILDVQRVLAEARGVSGVGQPAAVVGDLGGADGEEGMPFGQDIAVEDHVLRPFAARPGELRLSAAEDRVLLALFGARQVPPVAVAEGHGYVGLLDVAEHLVVEIVAQAGQGRHFGFGVGVFRLEIGDDFGVFLVAQPGVVVGEDGSVEL